MPLSHAQKEFIHDSVEFLFATLEEEKPNIPNEALKIKQAFSSTSSITEEHYRILQEVIKTPMTKLSRLEQFSSSLELDTKTLIISPTHSASTPVKTTIEQKRLT